MKLLAETIVSVTEFRKSPHLPDGVNLMAVMKNNEAEYYCITPEKLAQLLNAEIVGGKAIRHIIEKSTEHLFISGE